MWFLLKIRALLFYIIISLITILFYLFTYIPLKYASNYSTKYKIAKLFSEIFIYVCKYVGGIDYKFEGLEKLPTEPALVLANHQSFWDNVIMQLIIPEHSWVLKKQLYSIPVLGSGLKMMDPIAIDRSTNFSVKNILQDGQKKFDQKLWLVMFPESTRLRPEQTVKFKTSGAKLALICKVPIVLIAHNAGVFWPKGFWFKKTGVVRVKITKVLYPEEIAHMNAKELTKLIEDIINTEKNNLLPQYILPIA